MASLSTTSPLVRVCVYWAFAGVVFVCYVLTAVAVTSTIARSDGERYSTVECPGSRRALRKECRDFLDNFTSAASDFTHCMMSTVKPTCFCEFCYEEYKDVTGIYGSLKHSPQCKETLLAGDFTQAIQELYNFVTTTWTTRAHCRNCFKPHSDNITEEASQFYELVLLLDNCFNMSKAENLSVCDVCKKNYTSLVSYYNDKFGRDPSRVCADISDHMNFTVSEWETHHCHGISNQITAVVLISAVVLILTVGFYVSVYCCHVRQQKILRDRRSPSVSRSREGTPHGRDKQATGSETPILDQDAKSQSLN